MEWLSSLPKFLQLCPRESLSMVCFLLRVMFVRGTCNAFLTVQNIFVTSVLVQDKSNGRVQTIVDNRAALTAQRLAGGNKESMAAMSQLLGGGGKK